MSADPVHLVPNPELVALAGNKPALDHLSVRDYFAAHALGGIISAHTGDHRLPDERTAAKDAFAYADAMLKKRAVAPN